MTFIDTAKLAVLNKRPGWRGRAFHSKANTFVWWDFSKGANIHHHEHAQEEVWQVISGELEVTIAGRTQICGPGAAAIIPPKIRHSVVALSDGRAIVTDYPVREGF